MPVLRIATFQLVRVESAGTVFIIALHYSVKKECVIIASMTVVERKELENLIEQKMLEFLGDPDSGLELKKGFVSALRKKMRGNQKPISHAAVLKKYGLR